MLPLKQYLVLKKKQDEIGTAPPRPAVGGDDSSLPLFDQNNRPNVDVANSQFANSSSSFPVTASQDSLNPASTVTDSTAVDTEFNNNISLEKETPLYYKAGTYNIITHSVTLEPGVEFSKRTC